MIQAPSGAASISRRIPRSPNPVMPPRWGFGRFEKPLSIRRPLLTELRLNCLIRALGHNGQLRIGTDHLGLNHYLIRTSTPPWGPRWQHVERR
jgi:hypothetical protein